MQPVLRSWYEREGLFWEPEEMAGFHLAPDALRGLCPVFERRWVRILCSFGLVEFASLPYEARIFRTTLHASPAHVQRHLGPSY